MRVWNTLLLRGNAHVVIEEKKFYYWFVQPMYASFGDLAAKEKPLIHPSLDYIVVRR